MMYKVDECYNFSDGTNKKKQIYMKQSLVDAYHKLKACNDELNRINKHPKIARMQKVDNPNLLSELERMKAYYLMEYNKLLSDFTKEFPKVNMKYDKKLDINYPAHFLTDGSLSIAYKKNYDDDNGVYKTPYLLRTYYR